MASFDIQLLFINSSLNETIDICVDKTFGKKKKVKGMFKRHIKQILIISVKSSCFLFNEFYYKQIDSTMGYLLGPTLENLFLIYYERNWLKNCPNQFRPKYYCRYFDDTFFMFEHKDHVEKFLRYPNSRHSNIQFTCEE